MESLKSLPPFPKGGRDGGVNAPPADTLETRRFRKSFGLKKIFRAKKLRHSSPARRPVIVRALRTRL